MTAVVVIFMRLPTDFSSKHSNCPLHACTISISKTVRKIATCSIQFLCYQIAITPASRTLLPLLLLHLYWLFIHRQGCHSHCWIVGQSWTTIFSCQHCCSVIICTVFVQTKGLLASSRSAKISNAKSWWTCDNFRRFSQPVWQFILYLYSSYCVEKDNVYRISPMGFQNCWRARH